MSDAGWVLEAKRLSYAIPSSDLLSGGSDWLNTTTLGQISPDAASAFSAAMYRLKEGQSVAVSLPAPSLNTVVQLLIYLHRCRADSLLGISYAGWLNPYNMKEKSELLCFTRPISRFSSVADIPGSTPHIINKIPLKKTKRQLQNDKITLGKTILSNHNVDYEVLDFLSNQTSPFFIVIDATPSGGCKDLTLLWNYLSDLFPNTPKLVLFASGNIALKKEVNKLQINLWQQRPLDQASVLNRKHSINIQINVAVNADLDFDQLLNQAGQHCKELFLSLKNQEQRQTRKVLSPLYKVLRIIANLPCPYSMHQQVLEKKRKGGIYPVRPLNELVDNARKESMPTGDAQYKLSVTCNSINELITLCESGVQGKAQALLEILRKHKNDPFKIIVDDQYIAIALRNWLLKESLLSIDDKKIHVLPAESLSALDKLSFANNDHIIWLAKAWDNRFWWLLYANKITWLVYPGEKKTVEKLLAYNLTDEFVTRSDSSNKKNWWRYINLTQGKDGDIVNDDHIFHTEMANCTGAYKLSFAIEIPRVEITNWLDLLQSSDIDVEKWEKEVDYDESTNYALIHVEEKTAPIKLPLNNFVDVLTSKGKQSLDQVIASDLEEGQLLLLLSDGEGRETLRELLYNQFSRSDKQNIDQTRLFAQLWHQSCSMALEKFNHDFKELHREIEKRGIAITLDGVKGWLSKKFIGPQKDKAIDVMATISGIDNTQHVTETVKRCIVELRSEHIKIGKAMNQALRQRANGASEIKFGKTNIDCNTLDEIINVVTVSSVEIKQAKEIVQQKLTLKEKFLAVTLEYNDKIIVTPRAIRSLVKSQFIDHEKAINCVKLLATLFYKVYTNQTTFEQIKPTLSERSVAFTPDMSDKSKGVTGEYSVNYKGQNTDIGKHLGIGNSRDAKRCFRVHFHWDECDKKIVIHHAGKHLKTAND